MLMKNVMLLAAYWNIARSTFADVHDLDVGNV